MEPTKIISHRANRRANQNLLQDFQDFRKPVARLESCFGGDTQQELTKLNRRQLEGESLRSLAADIRDASSVAYQDLPTTAQERFCIQHFIDAIDDRYDRMRLRGEKPRSLDEALSTSCELEAFRLLETSKSKPLSMRALSTDKENNMAAVTQATQRDRGIKATTRGTI